MPTKKYSQSKKNTCIAKKKEQNKLNKNKWGKRNYAGVIQEKANRNVR